MNTPNDLPSVGTALETALNRIEDMLSDDDGQAFKEARKFLPVGRAALAAQPGSVPDSRPLRDYLKERIANMTPEQLAAFESARARIQESLAAAPTEAKPAQQDAVDAERYRELRRGMYWSVVDAIGDHLRDEALDGDIDAAISAKKGGAA